MLKEEMNAQVVTGVGRFPVWTLREAQTSRQWNSKCFTPCCIFELRLKQRAAEWNTNVEGIVTTLVVKNVTVNG